MRRRDLLKGLAALPLASALPTPPAEDLAQSIADLDMAMRRRLLAKHSRFTAAAEAYYDTWPAAVPYRFVLAGRAAGKSITVAETQRLFGLLKASK